MASTNGRARFDDDKVRVAIIGVGNCSTRCCKESSTTRTHPTMFVPGLMHVNLGGYHVRDIEFAAAFDIVRQGRQGSQRSISAHPNNTIKFSEVPKTGVKVSRGMTHDGIGKYLSRGRREGARQTDDIVKILKDTKTDVVVNYLPVGSEMATKWYTEQILDAGCA